MKLSEWAKQKGICYKTAWRYFKAGKIPGAYQTHTGLIVIPISTDKSNSKTVVYARVSSSEQKEDLKRQVDRVISFCNAKGWGVDHVYQEIGSGLHDKRVKVLQVLKDKSITRIVVEHKDRFARFGLGAIEVLLSLDNRELVVINKVMTDEQDLMQDFVSIITSFVARLYGSRRSKRKKEAILNILSTKD